MADSKGPVPRIHSIRPGTTTAACTTETVSWPIPRVIVWWIARSYTVVYVALALEQQHKGRPVSELPIPDDLAANGALVFLILAGWFGQPQRRWLTTVFSATTFNCVQSPQRWLRRLDAAGRRAIGSLVNEEVSNEFT